MLSISLAIILGLFASGSASLSGPYLFWGQEKVINLQPKALIEASENDFASLFKSVKAIVIFVRNNTHRLEGDNYPKFQQLIQNNAWVYLPQHTLVTEPFNYNTNIEVINLNGNSESEDRTIVSNFNESVKVYGEGKVLGILARRENDQAHNIRRRQTNKDEEKKKTEEAENQLSSTSTPATEETDESFIYLASGNKAILYVNAAPLLNISATNESLKLLVHNKEISFDDQYKRGYGRLSVIFTVNGKKLILRFYFNYARQNWSVKEVLIEYDSNETTLPIVGDEYSIPTAPVGFSYRCSSRPMIFSNGNDTLVLHDYQVQPWLNGSESFGDVIYCVGFVSSAILSGIFVTMILGVILTIGLVMLWDIKTPNRFESTRSKPLTIDLQE